MKNFTISVTQIDNGFIVRAASYGQDDFGFSQEQSEIYAATEQDAIDVIADATIDFFEAEDDVEPDQGDIISFTADSSKPN